MQGEINWKRRVMLFLISQSITLFGSTLVQMAIVWYVTLATSSGAWISAFTICSYVPQFLMSFVGGVWADRYNRKALIIAADALIAFVTLVLMLVMPAIDGQTPLLYAILGVSILRSLAAGVQTPAVNAMLPQLVPEDQLMRFNGVNATLQAVMQFAAPAAAGVLLTFSTLRASLLVDIATAAVGIGMLGCIAIPKTAPKQTDRASVLGEMMQGIRYAFSNPFLGRLLVAYGLFIFFSVPAGFLAQLFVSRTFGETYWYLTAVELVGFAGMTAGGLLMSVWGGFTSRTRTLLVGLAAFGALSVGMGLSRSFVFYLALMLTYGVALTMVQTATTTLVQEVSDSDMQGRVFGLMGSMYAGFLPIGMAIFGPLADAMPMRWMMLGAGVLLLLLSMGLRLDRRFFSDGAKE